MKVEKLNADGSATVTLSRHELLAAGGAVWAALEDGPSSIHPRFLPSHVEQQEISSHDFSDAMWDLRSGLSEAGVDMG
jgi:hypothetical protein